MTPDSPKPPREELEAQLTAFILGELPADQAFALGQAIEKDPELATLYARLLKTVELVRETAANPAEQSSPAPMPLKMSGERREKLLAQFKTVEPKEFAEPHRSLKSLVLPIAAAAAIMLLAAVIILPNFVKARTSSMRNSMINNLRQLDGAKQQWALEHLKSENDTPTLEDLKPYLRGSVPPTLMAEKYELGRVSDPVTADVEVPGGTRLFGNSSKRVRYSADGKVTDMENGSVRLWTELPLARPAKSGGKPDSETLAKGPTVLFANGPVTPPPTKLPERTLLHNRGAFDQAPNTPETAAGAAAQSEVLARKPNATIAIPVRSRAKNVLSFAA